MAQVQQILTLFLDTRLLLILDGFQNFSCNFKGSNAKPEQDLSPEVVSDTVEELLIEQDLADGPVEGRVTQVGQYVFSEFLKSNFINFYSR